MGTPAYSTLLQVQECGWLYSHVLQDLDELSIQIEGLSSIEGIWRRGVVEEGDSHAREAGGRLCSWRVP